MFQSDELNNHLATSSTIKSQSLVLAEWNMNFAENIYRVGNYRYRPVEPQGSAYRTLANSFDEYDEGNFYTGATDADVIIDAGYSNNLDENDQPIPMTFQSKKTKDKMLYSLDACLERFRPRSGINKLRYFENRYTNFSHPEMAKRPRYYMADKNDRFKYWSSYRTEDGIERGISKEAIGATKTYRIEDAAPFVVYKDPIPANRIVVKMQTNVGSVDLGPFENSAGPVPDPFYGVANSTTPLKWRIQYLENDSWVDAVKFDENSLRPGGLPIVGSDGYVEIGYGLMIPLRYQETFVDMGEVSDISLLPQSTETGYAYLIKDSDSNLGNYHIWTGSGYEVFVPEYGWSLQDETITSRASLVSDLVSPNQYTTNTGKVFYREFSYISGIRIVVETMNLFDSTFDLIEMSPRLVADLSGKTSSYKISKVASDLGATGMPVGQLLASTGSITLFDYDQAFYANNTNSIISKYLSKSMQIKFYDEIIGVNSGSYFVPLKTMYSSGFPEINDSNRSISLELRDMYFYLESLTAPQIFVQDVSVSYAVSLLLDSIGFSNYSFKRVDGEDEMTIPFFFIPPDTTVAQVLNDIAISTQTAMFFDEYNNFIMMSKNYLMPSTGDRDIDLTLYGSVDAQDSGVLENGTIAPLANIIDISSRKNEIYNDGKINYVSRSIQRSVGSLDQVGLIDRDRTWIYKPVLLWEVAGTESTKSVNDEVSDQSSYVLGAIPMNTDLSSLIPSVENFKIVNNTIDLGEGIYWITRYNGYFYANGEVIKYDAVQYSIPGLNNTDADGSNVWISSLQEYQNYFSKVPFNGKIYPTGLVRIYSEPFYETVNGVTRFKNGKVKKHGRGQFGTQIVSHSAGLNSHWSNNDNVRGCTMNAQYLFNSALDVSSVSVQSGPAGVETLSLDRTSTRTTRNGIIKNYLSGTFTKESEVNQMLVTQTGTTQSSALVMTGPPTAVAYDPLNFVSYVYKPLSDSFKHFGTRLRIVGKPSSTDNQEQTPNGVFSYYSNYGYTPSQNITIGGASGGISILVDPATNNGYYFEVAALTNNNVASYASSDINNVLFYKIMKDSSGGSQAIPVKLWGGLTQILVDDGQFTGQARVTGEENPTVYDLSIEYQDIGSSRRFFLYINNKMIAIVNDPKPLPVYNNMALFVRGSSRVMFENVFALNNNYSQNTTFALDTPVASIFGDQEVTANEAFRKYAMSGMVSSTYLSGLGTAQAPKYNLYFEEFGTIMREAAYFNIRYDKAYPALYAKISPTFSRIKGYTVSGFVASSYGAEFMIFNSTDAPLSLDETSGNYLRIQGITFTQQSTNELTVDDYFGKRSDLSDPVELDTSRIVSPLDAKSQLFDIKVSRSTYGRNEFNLNPAYIQTQDDADEMMGWIISKVMKPRKSVGVKIFSIPTLQLGDIVTINYKNKEGVDVISDSSVRYVVYNIDYSRDSSGPEMTIYLSEVI